MLPLGKLAPNTNLYNVNEKEMKIWSEATQSSGLLGIDVLNTTHSYIIHIMLIMQHIF